MKKYIYVVVGIVLLLAIGFYVAWRGAVQNCESVINDDPGSPLLFSIDRPSLPPGVSIDDSQPFLLFITNTTAVDLYLLTPDQWAAYAENKERVPDAAISIPPGKNLSAVEYDVWNRYMQSLMAPTVTQPQLYLIAEGNPVAVPYTIVKAPDPNLDPAAVQRAVECQRLAEDSSLLVAEEPISVSAESEAADTAVAAPWLLLVISLLVVGLLMARAVFRQNKKT